MPETPEVLTVNAVDVSVIIPTYNRADMLKEAVASVLAQDWLEKEENSARFELLIVDDGSADHTPDIIRSFGGRISSIRSGHRGVSAARNLGIERTQGGLIAFLDSDDLWKKNKLSVQMNVMKAFPGAVMCYTEETWIRNGRFVNPRKKHRKYSGWIFDKVLPICLLSLSSAFFRRSVFDEIGRFDENLPVCEDYDLGIRLACRHPWHLIEKPLIIKRGGHPDQLSRRFHSMDIFRIKALEKALSLDLMERQGDQVRGEIVNKSRILLHGFRKRRKMIEARYYEELIKKYS